MKHLGKSFDFGFRLKVKGTSKNQDLFFNSILENSVKIFFKLSFKVTFCRNWFEQYLGQ